MQYLNTMFMLLIRPFWLQADTFSDGWTCSGVGKGTKSIGELLKEHGYYTSWLGSETLGIELFNDSYFLLQRITDNVFSAMAECHTGMAGNSYVPGSRGFTNTMGFFGNGVC